MNRFKLALTESEKSCLVLILDDILTSIEYHTDINEHTGNPKFHSWVNDIFTLRVRLGKLGAHNDALIYDDILKQIGYRAT